jgi:hypothetical protein
MSTESVAVSTDNIVERMARRDASGHLLAASAQLSVRIDFDVMTCPSCHADANHPYLPIRGWEPGYDWAPESNGHPTVRLLSCESLTARSLLLLGAALARFPALRYGTFGTRAATWASWGWPTLDDTSAEHAIARIDAAEAWADTLLDQPDAPVMQAIFTLPTAVRRAHGQPGPHFLTHHTDGARLHRLNETYLRTRLAAVRDGLSIPA